MNLLETEVRCQTFPLSPKSLCPKREFSHQNFYHLFSWKVKGIEALARRARGTSWLAFGGPLLALKGATVPPTSMMLLPVGLPKEFPICGVPLTLALCIQGQTGVRISASEITAWVQISTPPGSLHFI